MCLYVNGGLLMKWKLKPIFSLVLVLSLMTACSVDKNHTNGNEDMEKKVNILDKTDNEPAKASTDKSSPIDNTIQDVEPNTNALEKTGGENGYNNEKNYKVENTSYNEKEVSINFPSVAGLNDTIKQKKINEILKQEALVVFNDFYGGKADGLSLKINYKVTWQSKNLLSIQYYGHAFDKGAAYPLDLLYTVNLDMNNGSKLVLKDFVNVDKDFVNKYRNYKVADPDKNQMEAGAFKYILDTYSVDDLIKYFNGADTSFKESAFTFSYLKKDALGISIEVPHAAGDHLEIELKYQDIKDNIKTGNEIWKDLLH